MAHVPYGNGDDVALAVSALVGKRPFAQRIGLIIATFAMIESEMPHLLVKLTGLQEADAASIAGVFRAFSNRIELLEQVLTQRPQDAVQTKVFRYFLGVIREANTMRNKFAHAHYGYLGGEKVKVVPYGDWSKLEHMTVDQIQAQLVRMQKIAGQVLDFIRANNIPGALHAELSRQSE